MKNVIRFLKDNNRCLPFLLFLKRNGCIDSFFNNIASERGLSGEAKEKYIIRYLKNTLKVSFIAEAFSFYFTNEGGAYWMLIHQKWVDNLSRYKKQRKKNKII